MDQKQWNEILEKQIEKIRNVLTAKSEEYSSDTDKLYNFKQAALLSVCSVPYALVGMMNKHIVSVYDIVNEFEKTGKLASEAMIDEKIGDAINYLILLKMVFTEIHSLKWNRLFYSCRYSVVLKGNNICNKHREIVADLSACFRCRDRRSRCMKEALCNKKIDDCLKCEYFYDNSKDEEEK